MDDGKIIDLLFERAENALEEVARKYSRLYGGILGEVLDDNGDREECANEVLLAVWDSIPPNRPESFPAYLCKIARRIGINRLKYNTRQKRNTSHIASLSELSECIPDRMSLLFADEKSEGIRAVLSEFVRGLDPETRVLFVRRYVYLETAASLAERFAMSENHVSVKLFRARKKLKKRLEKEDIRV